MKRDTRKVRIVHFPYFSLVLGWRSTRPCRQSRMRSNDRNGCARTPSVDSCEITVESLFNFKFETTKAFEPPPRQSPQPTCLKSLLWLRRLGRSPALFHDSR